jgi:hypothetical protein
VNFGDELTESFRDAYPDDFIEEAMRLHASEYRTAYDECAAFYPWEEAHDLRPHARRAKIEARIRDLANSYPGMAATVEPNITKTNYHTRIVSKNVILTVNHVKHPNEMVRRAEFRNTYARSPQRDLFTEDAPAPEGGYLYAILLHGESKRNPKRPDFMLIGFPDAECKSYIYQIDLFAIPRFKALANELWPVQAESIRDDLKLNLRSDAKKKKKKEEDGGE